MRILASWREQMPQQVIYSRLHVPELTLEELMEDFFGPLARDGASILEVQVRLQKALGYLHAIGDERMRLAALEQSNRALDRADLAGFATVDRATIEAAAEWSRASIRNGADSLQTTPHSAGMSPS